MNQTIKIEIKSVYGRDMYYVRSPEHIEPLKGLTQHTTLTESDMSNLKALGFSFESVQAKVPPKGWESVPV
jgi:hypothetical protein